MVSLQFTNISIWKDGLHTGECECSHNTKEIGRYWVLVIRISIFLQQRTSIQNVSETGSNLGICRGIASFFSLVLFDFIFLLRAGSRMVSFVRRR
jgi:hypothetical protein